MMVQVDYSCMYIHVSACPSKCSQKVGERERGGGWKGGGEGREKMKVVKKGRKGRKVSAQKTKSLAAY